MCPSRAYETSQLERIEMIGKYSNDVGMPNTADQGSVITRLIESRLTLRPAEMLEFMPGEAPEGVADRHFHPVEPRTIRASVLWNF